MYEDDNGEIPATRLTWQPLVGIAACGVASVLESVAGMCRAVAGEFFSDANYAEEIRAFHREATLELESLTTGSPWLPSAPDLEDDDEDYDIDDDED